MRPFHFGTRDRRLYGVYHAAAPRPGVQRAALICSAWGPEYSLSHRAIRNLATSLAAAGVHVLRFDYYGTGDSAGASLDGSLHGWAEDTMTALDELRAISGVAKVVLIGLRLGSLLAAMVVDDQHEAAEALLVWDPILRRDYLQELGETAARVLGVAPLARDGGGVEIYGHPISCDLAESLLNLDTGSAIRRTTKPVTLIISGEGSDYAGTVEAIAPKDLKAGHHIAERACWSDDGALSTGFVPLKIIHTIVEAVA